VWALLAAVFVLRYQPLRDNNLLVLPYAFALPAGISLGLAARRLRPRALALAAAAGALVLAAGWIQQLHRVRLDRAPEALTAAAARLDRVTRPDQVVISDQPIVAFLAHRRVPGNYVDTANLRFDTRSLTEAEVLRDADRVAALFVGRAFAEHPALLAALPRHFRHHVSVPGGVIFYGH
jgi:hypothetical protein